LSIYTTSISDGSQDVGYLQRIIATGGTGDRIWTDKYYDLVGTGISISSSGLMSGIPCIGGTVEFTARVTDQVGAFDERLFSFFLTPSYMCGDINGQGGLPDISDLMYLVDYLFNMGPTPPDMQAANVNGLNEVDISDLTYMVAYFFGGGPEPVC